MLYSVKELANYVGVTRQRVNTLCKAGRLSRVNGKLDSEDPLNHAWIHLQHTTPAAAKPIGQSSHRVHIPAEGAEDEEVGVELTNLSSEELSKLPKAVIDKLKSLEGMLKARQAREVKRRDLIERSLVAQAFGELYTIDSNSWKTLGAKIAADVAGMCNCDDPEKVLLVEQRIDGEVLKVLSHVKSVLDTTLKSWEPK